MSSNYMHPKVAEYFAKQEPDKQKVLKRLRSLILKTFPKIDEDYMWGVPVYDGGRFYIAALKKQVNIGFSIVGLDKDEIDLFEGSGKTMRHIKVPLLESIDEKQLVKLIRLVKRKAKVLEC